MQPCLRATTRIPGTHHAETFLNLLDRPGRTVSIQTGLGHILHGNWQSMSHKQNRLIVWLTLASFVTANGTALFLAGRAPAICPCESANLCLTAPAQSDSMSPCQHCCTEQTLQSASDDETCVINLSQPIDLPCPCHDDESPCPFCPCADGCVFCSVAKTPCHLPAQLVGLPSPPALDRIDEPAPVYSPRSCFTLFRPPRA